MFKLYSLHWRSLVYLPFPSFLRLMILMKHRTTKSNMETNLCKLWPDLGEAVFFTNFSFEKSEDF